MKRHSKLAIAFVLASGIGSFAAFATAAGQASDRAVAAQIVEELSSLPEAERQAVLPPLEQAQKALERAMSARGGGDSRAGELLEGLAREWAETAREVRRATQAEADAGAIQAEAADAGVRAERARTLLEEAIARRGRAEAELRTLTDGAEKAGASEATTKKPSKDAAKKISKGAK